jgi:hypothetical protein
MGRSGVPLRTRMRSPSFRAKNFSTCTRSPTARGSSHASLYVMGRCCLLVSELDRHLEIGPVSQLYTWPVVSPVNASRRPSRDAMHHLGSGRLAIPYPMGDFHLLFFASKTGALCSGSIASAWLRADHFRSAPINGQFLSRSACLKGRKRKCRYVGSAHGHNHLHWMSRSRTRKGSHQHTRGG